jgi:hypothetical protein
MTKYYYGAKDTGPVAIEFYEKGKKNIVQTLSTADVSDIN